MKDKNFKEIKKKKENQATNIGKFRFNLSLILIRAEMTNIYNVNFKEI